MTIENRDWITEDAKVAIISTGRLTGIETIKFDRILTIDARYVITANGQKFDIETLNGEGSTMHQWRMADPESPETKLDIAVQARDKALRAVREHEDNLDRDPSNPGRVEILIEALTQYNRHLIAANKLAEELKAKP